MAPNLQLISDLQIAYWYDNGTSLKICTFYLKLHPREAHYGESRIFFSKGCPAVRTLSSGYDRNQGARSGQPGPADGFQTIGCDHDRHAEVPRGS